MVRYTVEERDFLYEPYAKCGSARKSRTFPRITVPRVTGTHKVIKYARCTGSRLDKKPAKNSVLTKGKLEEMVSRLENTSQKFQPINMVECVRASTRTLFSASRNIYVS
jgi:hypothetical protein